MRGDTLWKWIIIGNSGVGKTSMLSRLCNDDFNNTFISTIGIDFKIKKMEVGGKYVTVQIWDTAGQERFGTITRSCYRGANGVLLVYDTNDRNSFDDVNRWLQDIKLHTGENTAKILVGNKCDMTSSRAVKTEEGQNVADNNGIPFVETSAKTGKNIQQAFTALAELVLEDIYPDFKSSVKAAVGSGTSVVTQTSKTGGSNSITGLVTNIGSNSKTGLVTNIGSTSNTRLVTNLDSNSNTGHVTKSLGSSSNTGLVTTRSHISSSELQTSNTVKLGSFPSAGSSSALSMKRESVVENPSFTLTDENNDAVALNAKKSRCCSKS